MKKKLMLANIAFVMGLSSCGTNQAIDINGEWKVESINGESVPATLEEAVLSFDNSTHNYHGVTGVNMISGSYQQDEKSLTIGEGAMTRKMGDSISNEIETRYINAIHATRSVSEDNGKLILLDNEGKQLMILEKK